MKNQSLLYGVIGLLLGIIIAWSVSVYAVNGNRNGMMRSMGMGQHVDNMMMGNSMHGGSCSGGQCVQGQ